ncbi:putative transmembrane protein [Phytophthora cinnamomi]|uniref:putative transmembrane protein n=1 Tax=Phytophthora cinnamomi TaxID=4785 RepID=UPI003559A9F6|nr:putative transmembrane protein [Phytophthora cinnamomi]
MQFEDDGFTNSLGFRPIVLYDAHLDMADESLTLSRSRKEQQLPHFSTLSSCELDDIDASCSLQRPSRDLQQPTTPNTQPLPLQTEEYSPPPRSRERGFAMGDMMFNYRALGSLRSGLAPIALFSRWHFGLAVTALVLGAAEGFVRAAYRPLLLTTLNAKFNKKYDADTALLDWSGILSVLLGLFSDCMPIYGTRRKAYIALGWILSAASYASVCAIYTSQVRDVQKPDRIFGCLLEAWSVAGSFALQLSWVTALALVVGFGQRETLSERGGLAMLFLILWQGGNLVAYVTVAGLQATLTLVNASVCLASASLLALVFVVCFLHDDDELESTATLVASTKRFGVVPALRTGIIQLWEVCQEKVTYRVLFFLLTYGVLLKACDPGVHKALVDWSGFAPDGDDNVQAENPWVLVIESGAALAALLHAKWRLLNTAWRPLAITGAGIVATSTLIQATLIATNAARSKWFFSLFMAFIVWPKTWILLFVVLTTTEVTHVGCEGVTMGLVLSGRNPSVVFTCFMSSSAPFTSFLADHTTETMLKKIITAATPIDTSIGGPYELVDA